MSFNCYPQIAKDRKLTTIKYPTMDDNSDWEYAITDKKDVKEVEKYIQSRKIKDMKTILFNTKQMILEAKNANNKN